LVAYLEALQRAKPGKKIFTFIDSVQTIEFNTGDFDNINGGAVAKKDRPFKVIQGFIKLY
jgi:hypothetical protein